MAISSAHKQTDKRTANNDNIVHITRTKVITLQLTSIWTRFKIRSTKTTRDDQIENYQSVLRRSVKGNKQHL